MRGTCSRFGYYRRYQHSQHPISTLTPPHFGFRCSARNSKFNPNYYRKNVNLDAAVIASSVASASNPASNANDEGEDYGSDEGSSWIAKNTDAQWIRFEMPSERTIFAARILWSNHSSHYEIQVSRDGSSESWHTVATEFRAKQGIWKDTVFETQTSGRFWRVYSHTRSVHTTAH
jgi:hypothetical protein